jgi:hypothetical protein
LSAITPEIFNEHSKEEHQQRLTAHEMPFRYQIVLGMLSGPSNLNNTDNQEDQKVTSSVEKASLAPIDALEEELMEREGFRYTSGKTGVDHSLSQHERVSFHVLRKRSITTLLFESG